MKVWYDIEYNKFRIWPASNLVNRLAEMDDYMIYLGYL